MPHLEWNESLKVRVDELDRQHRRFIEMANDLHDALMEGDLGQVEDTRDNTLRNLQDYLRDHFGKEEVYMEKIGYPDIGTHREAHRSFAREVEGYVDALASGDMVLNSEIMKTMLNWIFAHIATEDARYRDFAGSG